MKNYEISFNEAKFLNDDLINLNKNQLVELNKNLLEKMEAIIN